jgi:hypothetical protein
MSKVRVPTGIQVSKMRIYFESKSEQKAVKEEAEE